MATLHRAAPGRGGRVGTIYRRGDGWRAQVRRHGKARSASFPTKREALAWQARIEAEVATNHGALPARPRGTLAALIDRYEAEVYPLRPWGRGKAWDLTQLRADLGDQPLTALDQARIASYGLELRQRMAGGAALTRLTYLAGLCHAAEDLWGIATPRLEVERAIAGLKRQRMLTRTPPRTRRPLDAELDRIVAYGGASLRMEVDLGGILAVLRLVPLRVGELVAIEWADLRSAERAVVIRARKHPDTEIKAGNDYLVPLPTIDGVDTWPLIADRPRYLARPFPWSRGAVSSAFWLAAKVCGVEDLHLHDLRALAITRLLEAGIAIPLVAHMSGHRNWKILQRHYARIAPHAVHAVLPATLAAAS